jgi:hypothetical protein
MAAAADFTNARREKSTLFSISFRISHGFHSSRTHHRIHGCGAVRIATFLIPIAFTSSRFMIEDTISQGTLAEFANRNADIFRETGVDFGSSRSSNG